MRMEYVVRLAELASATGVSVEEIRAIRDAMTASQPAGCDEPWVQIEIGSKAYALLRRGWLRFHRGPRAGRTCHVRCFENFNELVGCGIDRGDCGNPQCCLSERWEEKTENTGWAGAEAAIAAGAEK